MAYSNPKPEILDNLVDTNTNNQEFVDYTKMKEVYFAFIDVLGFKKTFDDMKLTRNTKEAENFKDVFNYYFDIMNAAKFFDKKIVMLVMQDKRQIVYIFIQNVQIIL